MATMPIQKPGRSKQDYQTPPEFLAAVKKRLHTNVFGWDLAASKENTACEFGWYDEEQDSLKQNWHEIQNGWMWLNPPFSNIAPWVYKASDEAWKGAFIAMLVPASVGANWWRDFVHDDAHVLFLNGRLTFVGAEGPYPKDCALLLYQPAIQGGYDTWNWKR